MTKKRRSDSILKQRKAAVLALEMEYWNTALFSERIFKPLKGIHQEMPLVDAATDSVGKRKVNFVVPKVVVVLLFLTCFGPREIRCNEKIPFCKDLSKQLENDENDWRERCLERTMRNSSTCEAEREYLREGKNLLKKHEINETNWSERCLEKTVGQSEGLKWKMRNSPCCEAEMEYLRERKCVHSQMCFYKTTLSEPYLLMRSQSGITAIDLNSLNATAVISGLGGVAMDFDSIENMLYFHDGNTISKLRLNDEEICVKVVVKNVTANDLAIDWISRRIFWTDYIKRRIFGASLDGKNRSVEINTTRKPNDIVVDPLARFLFWTDDEGAIIRFNLNDSIKVALVSNVRDVYVIKLDCIKKRVYWLAKSSGNNEITSCDYAGKKKKTVASGGFLGDLLGVLGDLLYFLNTNESRINERNVSNVNISRKFLVTNTTYNHLLMVDKSGQPPVTEECSWTPCPRFGYCDKITASCHCEVGFKMKEKKCADIDECLNSSLTCGANATKNCTNIPGSYKCSACEKGIVLYKNPVNEGRCFGPGAYLFINTRDKIYAVQMFNKKRVMFVSELRNRWLVGEAAMAVDTVEMKLYFRDNNHIWLRDINGVDVNVVIENANPREMTIDWIGRRIFWTEYWSMQISVANLDGQGRRVVTKTTTGPLGIAIDALSGLLFWTEIYDGVIVRFNLADRTKVTLVTNVGYVFVMKLDFIKKRVYWLEDFGGARHIKSCDYGGKEKKTIASGPFDKDLLGVLGDSLYVLNTNENRINEMNVSSGNITRKILVDKHYYKDLTLVDESAQPTVTKECSGSPCPRFGYCNRITGLCQCEVGFEKNGSRCADINECLSLPCGPNATKNCTNMEGSYKCSACDEGLVLFKNPANEGRCFAYSDLKIRLVNGANNKTGRVEIFLPSFGWGTVCHAGWDDKDSAVVCRQLGFDGVKATRKWAYYGRGSGPILLTYVHCTGDESYIWDCSHNEWNVHYCRHSHDVGVDCY